MHEMTDTGPVIVPARQVWERYGITDMTLYRWIRDGVFPPPDRIINRRRYWRPETLADFDRQGAA